MSGLGDDRSAIVRKSLTGSEIHETWEAAFRTPANERFYEMAFDRIVNLVGAPEDSVFLDVGCGPGFHALRLARRGYRVRAIDFSEAILPAAREHVARAGLEDRIVVNREDLLSRSFADESQRYVLCWGVLMHIPDVATAVSELSRILKRGGVLVVAEGNVGSLEAVALRALGLLRRSGRTARRSPAGMENWKQTEAGHLLTRVANIGWLTNEFARHGLVLRERLPGQFTELYTKAPWGWLERGAHRLNWLWFRRQGSPRLARGNVLILEKPSA